MWLKTTIVYFCLVDGVAKEVKEHYLHDAITYGEVEASCPTQFIQRIPGMTTEHIDNLGKQSSIHEVLFHPLADEDHFWLIRVKFLDEKPYKLGYLLPAVGEVQASQRVRDAIGMSLIPYEITDLKATDILAVWRPHSTLWQGDWHNRMDRLYDEGKFLASLDVPDEPADEQTDLFPDQPKTRKKNRRRVREQTLATIAGEFRDSMQTLSDKDGLTATISYTDRDGIEHGTVFAPGQPPKPLVSSNDDSIKSKD